MVVESYIRALRLVQIEESDSPRCALSFSPQRCALCKHRCLARICDTTFDLDDYISSEAKSIDLRPDFQRSSDPMRHTGNGDLMDVGSVLLNVPVRLSLVGADPVSAAIGINDEKAKNRVGSWPT